MCGYLVLFSIIEWFRLSQSRSLFVSGLAVGLLPSLGMGVEFFNKGKNM